MSHTNVHTGVRVLWPIRCEGVLTYHESGCPHGGPVSYPSLSSFPLMFLFTTIKWHPRVRKFKFLNVCLKETLRGRPLFPVSQFPLPVSEGSQSFISHGSWRQNRTIVNSPSAPCSLALCTQRQHIMVCFSPTRAHDVLYWSHAGKMQFCFIHVFIHVFTVTVCTVILYSVQMENVWM